MKIHQLTVCAAAALTSASIFYFVSYAQQTDTPAVRQQKQLYKNIALQNERNYHFKGVISGRVLLNNGQPAVNFPVIARFAMHQTGAIGEGQTFTDANGKYVIRGLNSQDFYVQVEGRNKGYVPDAPQKIRLRQLPQETATNVNFTLYQGPEITVRVRDAQTGVPVPGLPVQTSSRAGDQNVVREVTDAQGEFRFRSGSLSTQINLDSAPQKGVHVSPAPGYSFFRDVTFPTPTAIQDVVCEVKTYAEDPRLRDTVLRGQVTDAHGQPVPGASVHLLRDSDQLSVTTDKLGNFALKTYRMQTSEYGNGDGREKKGLLFQVEKGALRTTHYATPEETWTAIPIRLENDAKATITGQAVSPEGKPLAGVPVSYTESFLKASAFTQKNGGTTDASGSFTVSGLSPDAWYNVTLGRRAADGNPNGWGKTEVPHQQTDNLKPNETRNIGRIVVWVADGTLAGKVQSRTGHLASKRLMMVIRGDHTDYSTQPDEKGAFHFESVVHEPLTLYVFQSEGKNGEGGWRTAPGSQDEVARAQVHADDNAATVTVP